MIEPLFTILAPLLEKQWPGMGQNLLDLSETSNPEFGDYQLNSAMKIAKIAKTSPKQVAEIIVNRLQSLPELEKYFEKVAIAGPGFINLTLKDHYLEKRMQEIIASDRLAISLPKKKERILVEFSSPNVAKELHVGHLRSTIIGDAIARLFETLGHEVLRINHIGDFGTQFGMIIAHLKERYPTELHQKELDIGFLLKAYKESKLRFDEDPEFKKRAQKEVVYLQADAEESLFIWNRIMESSRKSIQEIYDLLEIRIEERGESFYKDEIPGVIEELEQKNLITLSDGAKCLFIDEIKNREGNPMPLMVQKSDGGYGYDTTDLATIRWRIQKDLVDRIICVTDLGQELHFTLIFKAAEKAGWLKDRAVHLDHVGFGLVLGQDGKKFKTRSGETERLIDLLTAAIMQARKILDNRPSDLTPEEKELLAKRLGLSAIKYADLSCHRTSDYLFSYEKMLRFEGNTAAFLLYSHVRCQSILKKLGERRERHLDKGELLLVHKKERDLALHLIRFQDVLTLFAKELLPNRLTDYLFTLAEKFNLFFRDCRVDGALEEPSRTLLCEATNRTFACGFQILGLFPVEKM